MNIHQPISTNWGYFQEKYGEIWIQLKDSVTAEFSDAIEQVQMPQETATDLPVFFIKKQNALQVLEGLKTKYGYEFLSDYTATDEEEDPRFHLVLHLMSLKNFSRIRIKIRLSENETFPTLSKLWKGASWAEREIYDMFGVRFDEHPDLRRILMDNRWEGHPLRKDYPLRGYQVFLTPEPLDPELLK